MEKDQSKKLTNEVGAPVPSNEHSMTAGERGPVLMQDVWLMEKLAHFEREVIPERRMHAKGSGAFGKFTVTGDITKYSRAKVFEKIGKETEVFVRFSTVAGERGAAADDEPCFPAEEINDVAFYDILAVDLHRKTLQTIIPEERLLRRHVATQFASSPRWEANLR